MRIQTRMASVLGLLGLLGALALPAPVAMADQDDKRPPQVIPAGFESTDALQADAERNENGPLYSAWLLESSRFVNVPFGAFMPDRDFISPSTPRHDVQFINFPVNFGVIKGPDGKLTLYDRRS